MEDHRKFPHYPPCTEMHDIVYFNEPALVFIHPTPLLPTTRHALSITLNPRAQFLLLKYSSVQFLGFNMAHGYVLETMSFNPAPHPPRLAIDWSMCILTRPVVGQNSSGQNIPCHLLTPRTKHPTSICHPGQNIPCSFCHPRQNIPCHFCRPGQNIPCYFCHRTKHPTLCLMPMKVHKTSNLDNCHS